MKTFRLLSKTAVFLLLISISTVAIAWGWGLRPSTDVLPIAGETRGDVNWIVFDQGTGPCKDRAPVPDPLPPSDSSTLVNEQTVTTSTGILRPLGRVVMETAHCAEGPYALDGSVTFYANGGTIEGVYTADTLFMLPWPPPGSFPATGTLIVQETAYEITGGTGRFENVGGTLLAHVFVEVGEYGYAEDVTWTIRQALAGHIQFND